jgi:hypothetical protein
MKIRLTVSLMFLCLLLFFCIAPAMAADHPTSPITIKVEGAKMAPVVFSHSVHAGTQKIDCATCHHKDAADPKACTTCHGKDAKGAAVAAKDAFHTKCQTCHKEKAAKGAKAPTKCTECHKK